MSSPFKETVTSLEKKILSLSLKVAENGDSIDELNNKFSAMKKEVGRMSLSQTPSKERQRLSTTKEDNPSTKIFKRNAIKEEIPFLIEKFSLKELRALKNAIETKSFMNNKDSESD